MKKLQSLGRSLSKEEQKKVKGGFEDYSGDTCCDTTSDCPNKHGWTKACSTFYQCSTGRQKCFWVYVE